jgi:hypothetical protein
MRFSLDSTLLFLAFAHALVAPVGANEVNEPKRHVLSRASHGFRRSALRHSAGLARDLRVALRGLGTAETAHHRSVLARSNLGKKAYCVSNNGKRQSNSTAPSEAHHTVSSASKPTASGSTTTSPTSSPGQSNFRLAQSYVSNDSLSPPARVEWKENLLMLTIWGSPSCFHFSVWTIFFPGMGFFHWQRPDQWDGPICRSADRGACAPPFGSSCSP